MKHNYDLYGRVSIVGAGPGDPELLTLKALRRLGEADVVVYDRLVSKEILAFIPRGTMRIFAGKSCKQHTMTQTEINALLVALAQKGKHVVRLKGGDPFMFGRGGEEAEYLASHGVEFEIIPGITSANGCSAYGGIPLTHRGLATGVRYLTGHRMEDSLPGGKLELDWRGLADPNTTLVVYMGLANIGVITTQLIRHGLNTFTPVAAIEQGTTNAQRRIISNLKDLVQDIENAKLEAPTLLIIGRVVNLAGRLDWFGQNTTLPAPSRQKAG